MPTVEKLSDEMFDEVYTAFLAEDDQRLTRDDWHRLFVSRPDPEHDYSGFVLVDRGRIVGTLGMLFSERKTAEGTGKFCNLHSWFVKDQYRGHSLKLMRPALALNDHTLTDFTSTEAVCRISKRLGFQSLDATVCILSPFVRSPGKQESSDCQLTHDPEAIRQQVSPDDWSLLAAHLPHGCRGLLASCGGSGCLVIYSRVTRHWLPYCYVHYVSQPDLFVQKHKAIQCELRRAVSARFVAIDRRHLGPHRLPSSYCLPIQTRQLYRSPSDLPPPIDTLFSEVSLLKLSTLPGLRYSLQKMWRRKSTAAVD